MNIVLVTDAFPPEIRSISMMVQELAVGLVSRGHNVTVITSWPQYNLNIESRKKVFFTCLNENGVRIIRVKTLPHHNVNYIVRGIAQLSLPKSFFKTARKFLKEKIDSVLIYTPPLPLANLGVAFKKYYDCRFILNVQDIFPQNAIDLGILNNRPVIAFFEWMEKNAYRNADCITSHTENSGNFLIGEKNVPGHKINIIPNWIDVESFHNAKPLEIFRAKYNLQDKFIFLFPGIIGPSQNLGFILEIAKELKREEEVYFALVGEGTDQQRLESLIKKSGLSNIGIFPFIALKDYPSLLKEVDAGLVCLSIKNKTAVIPGKIMGFMAASLPVVAFLNKESDGHFLIRKAACGYSFLSDDVKGAVNLIRKVVREKDKLKKFGENGYKYAKENFSKDLCIDRLERLIKNG